MGRGGREGGGERISLSRDSTPRHSDTHPVLVHDVDDGHQLANIRAVVDKCDAADLDVPAEPHSEQGKRRRERRETNQKGPGDIRRRNCGPRWVGETDGENAGGGSGKRDALSCGRGNAGKVGRRGGRSLGLEAGGWGGGAWAVHAKWRRSPRDAASGAAAPKKDGGDDGGPPAATGKH